MGQRAQSRRMEQWACERKQLEWRGAKSKKPLSLFALCPLLYAPCPLQNSRPKRQKIKF